MLYSFKGEVHSLTKDIQKTQIKILKELTEIREKVKGIEKKTWHFS